MTGIIVVSLATSFFVAKYGLRGRATPIIKASNFVTPEYLAMYINRQLYQRLKTSSPIVFGYDKNNEYEKKAVEKIISYIWEDLKGKSPEIIQVSADESYSGSSSSRIEEIKKRYGNNILSFTLIDLKDVTEAPEILDCEKDQHYPVWIECTKAQKLRQIMNAKKVDFEKPIAIVEAQSQIDIMVYIRK